MSFRPSHLVAYLAPLLTVAPLAATAQEPTTTEAQDAPPVERDAAPVEQPAPVVSPRPVVATVPAPPHGPPLTAIADRAQRAVVTVRCQGRRWGTGFALGSDRQVVTASALRGCRRDLEVEGLDGRTTTARSVASDGPVAVIALDQSIGLEPLAVRETALGLGEPVFAVGVPRGAARPTTPIVTRGAVAYADAEQLQSDAPHPEDSEGGPLLDAQGEVVAVLREPSDADLQRSTPIASVRALVEQTSPDDEDTRPGVKPGLGVSFGMIIDSGDRLLGASVLFSLDILDRLIVSSEVGGYVSNDDERTVQTRRSLVVVSPQVGYRLRFGVGGRTSATLTPHIGFSFAHDKQKVTTSRIGFVDPTCDPGRETCLVTDEGEETESSRWRYRPSAGLRLGVGTMEIGYEVYLDVEELGDTGHRLHIGFRF